MKSVLVTGGAGYIGSHCVKSLLVSGYHVVVLDNLSNGHRDAVIGGELVVGNVGDQALLVSLFTKHHFVGVFHFASLIVVSESVEDPDTYFKNNVEQAKTLIKVASFHRTPFIFSSSAAVYGNPEQTPIPEAHPIHPTSPYGENKAAVEKLLLDVHRQSGLPIGILRYFNAAGAEAGGTLGERHDPETHLIPLALKTALSKRKKLYVFGHDYPTQDGTCIRDYVHVEDLVDAHLLLLDYISKGGKEQVFNLGTGQGYSVLEVIETASELTGIHIPYLISNRRGGDPAILVADGAKAKQVLNWKPLRSDLKRILTDAWNFEQKHTVS